MSLQDDYKDAIANGDYDAAEAIVTKMEQSGLNADGTYAGQPKFTPGLTNTDTRAPQYGPYEPPMAESPNQMEQSQAINERLTAKQAVAMQQQQEQEILREEIDRNKTPDQLYEELLTRHAAGESPTDLFLRYAETQRMPGEENDSLYPRVQAKEKQDVLARLPKRQSVGDAAIGSVSHPRVEDAADIYAARDRGKMAREDSTLDNFLTTMGYTGTQFREGLKDVATMEQYITAPIHVPINKAIHKYQDWLPVPGAEELARNNIPWYNTVRESLFGTKSMQDLLLPTDDRNALIDDFEKRADINKEEAKIFEPYNDNSGVGGFFGPMPVYIASQALAGPAVGGALKSITGIGADVVGGAANATGRGIQQGAGWLERNNVPMMSDLSKTIKQQYGPKVLQTINAFKNRSKLPLSPLTEGVASNASTNLALSTAESMLRPDEDWKQGVVAGIVGNTVAKAARGTLSEMPFGGGARTKELLDWAESNGINLDYGVKTGNREIQKYISGIYNNTELSNVTSPFRDKQNDVMARILMESMGVPRAAAGSNMSKVNWEDFWGKKGLGGEMDFRDANTSASFGPSHRDALSKLILDLEGNDLPGAKLASKQLSTLENMLSNRANGVGPYGPVTPTIVSKDMKDVLREFNALRAAYKKSDVPSKISAVEYLDDADRILQGMVDDVQVPKGLTYNGVPFDSKYVKNLNRRYAIASAINESGAIDLTGGVNANKLIASVYKEPSMLKKALRNQGSPEQQQLNNLAGVMELIKKSSHSALEGSPVPNTKSKIGIDEAYTMLPKDFVPSMVDVWRMDRLLSGKPGMTGLVGATGLPNMKNDRGMWTPYSLGRMDAAGAHIQKDLVGFGNKEYGAYDYYSQPGNESSDDNYAKYMAAKTRQNSQEMYEPHPFMKELSTDLKEVAYPAMFGGALLRELLRDKSKDSNSKTSKK